MDAMNSDAMSGAFENAEGRLAALPLPLLLARLRDKDNQANASQAAVEILRRFQPLLRKYWAWHRLGEYEDFVQEVMLRLFIALQRLRDANAFPGLLRRIVIGTATDALRSMHFETPDFAALDPDKLTVEFDESLATAVIVRSYLELLPPREQEVVSLLLFEDLDTGEVAQKVGLSVGAVRTTKSRAIRRLRKLLVPQKKSGRGDDAL
jgi:RNA polymerase sigma factor (sigma-70 family)